LNIDFYRNNNISVDLAIEAHDIVAGQLGTEIPAAYSRSPKIPQLRQ
jgi:hypothetical protein